MVYMENNTLGKRLKYLRSRKKLSQKELGDRIFVSDKTISKWENDISQPDMYSLIELADYFGVALDYLIRGKELEPLQGGQIVRKKDGSLDYYVSEEGDRLFTRSEVTIIVRKRIERKLKQITKKLSLEDINDLDEIAPLYKALQDTLKREEFKRKYNFVKNDYVNMFGDCPDEWHLKSMHTISKQVLIKLMVRAITSGKKIELDDIRNASNGRKYSKMINND